MNPRAPVRRRAAFSTVELVVVLALMGIITAIAVPRFFAAGSFEGRFFADELVFMLRHAQKVAVASGCPVQVDFDASQVTLSQRASCTSGGYTQPLTNPQTGQSGYARSAPSGVSLASSVDPIVFDGRGRALTGGGAPTNATITAGATSISVVGESGFVHVP